MPDHSIRNMVGKFESENYPVYPNRYKIKVQFPSGTENTEEFFDLFCMSAVIPGRRINTASYSLSRQPIMIPYSYGNEEVTFRFLLEGQYIAKQRFDEWMEAIMNSETYELSYMEDQIADKWIVTQLGRDNNEEIYSEELHYVQLLQVGQISFQADRASDVQAIDITISYVNKKKKEQQQQ